MGRLFRDDRTGWWIADYFDSAGKRHRLKASKDPREAKEMLALLEGQAIRERYLDVKPLKQIRFGGFAELFMKHVRTQMRAWKRYESSLRSLTPFFGNLHLTAIDPEMIERYKQLRVTNVQKATVNRDLQCLKRMFNLAIVWRYARENPVRLVKFFRERGWAFRRPGVQDHHRPQESYQVPGDPGLLRQAHLGYDPKNGSFTQGGAARADHASVGR